MKRWGLLTDLVIAATKRVNTKLARLETPACCALPSPRRFPILRNINNVRVKYGDGASDVPHGRGDGDGVRCLKGRARGDKQDALCRESERTEPANMSVTVVAFPGNVSGDALAGGEAYELPRLSAYV